MHKENKIVFKVTIVDNTKPAEGKINIQSSEKKIFTEQIQEVESGCLGIKKIKVKDIEREHTELKDVCSCDLKILKKDSGIICVFLLGKLFVSTICCQLCYIFAGRKVF